MRIYLTGFMGSGKSTVGSILADRLAVPFLETDQVVEMTLGLSIPEIFIKHGERMFRDAEFMALRTTVMLPEGVIALGGGTPCSEQAQEFLGKDCFTIYLDTPAAELAGRLMGTARLRPLLKNVQDDELPAVIEKLMIQREPWYRMAQLVVSTVGRSPAEVVEEIIQYLPK